MRGCAKRRPRAQHLLVVRRLPALERVVEAHVCVATLLRIAQALLSGWRQHANVQRRRYLLRRANVPHDVCKAERANGNARSFACTHKLSAHPGLEVRHVRWPSGAEASTASSWLQRESHLWLRVMRQGLPCHLGSDWRPSTEPCTCAPSRGCNVSTGSSRLQHALVVCYGGVGSLVDTEGFAAPARSHRPCFCGVQKAQMNLSTQAQYFLQQSQIFEDPLWARADVAGSRQDPCGSMAMT